MLLTITAIAKYHASKDGTEYKNQYTGRQQCQVVLTTQEEGKVSGFVDAGHACLTQWKIGDQVNLDLKTRGSFKNFSFPKAGTQPNKNLEAIWDKLHQLEEEVALLKAQAGTEKKVEQKAESYQF